MRIVLAVALGGALGAVGRYLVTEGVRAATGGAAFPWGTLAVNVVGSFALGVVLAAAQGGWLSADARPFLAVGALGSFTTFSALSWEMVALAQAGQPLRAGAYALASLSLGIAAVVAGMSVAGAWPRS